MENKSVSVSFTTNRWRSLIFLIIFETLSATFPDIHFQAVVISLSKSLIPRLGISALLK